MFNSLIGNHSIHGGLGCNPMSAQQQAYNQYHQNSLQNQYNAMANQAAMASYQSSSNWPEKWNLDMKRKEKEIELLVSNSGLQELKANILKAQEEYDVFLALLMPSDSELRGESK